MRAAFVSLAVVGLLLAAVGVGSAQAPPPTVLVTANDGSLTVGTTGPLPAGPTRFEYVAAGGPPPEIAVAALRPGVTVAQFSDALRSDPGVALELVHIDGGVTFNPGQERFVQTFSLRPSTTYVAINIAGEDEAAWEITEFATSATENGAAAPKADARVRVVDLRFLGAGNLPRNGVVRWENAGWAPHFALAAPLRKNARKSAVAVALLGNRQKQLEKLLDFSKSVEAQSLFTRGAVDYNQVRFAKKGRHVLVCFFEGHNTQGMFKFVNVR